jgi:hypothetical protein
VDHIGGLNVGLLELGVFMWSAVLAIGYALLRSWAIVEQRQSRLWRVRMQTESLLRQQVDRAYDPDPGVSLNGLRILDDHWRGTADLMEPDAEEFIEAVAAYVVMHGSGRVVRDRRQWATRWTVPGHKAVAARLAVDIATTRGRQPNTIAEWITGLPTEVGERPALAARRLAARPVFPPRGRHLERLKLVAAERVGVGQGVSYVSDRSPGITVPAA